MHVIEEINAPPPAGIGISLHKKTSTTALALAMVIACAVSALAQPVPNTADSISATATPSSTQWAYAYGADVQTAKTDSDPWAISYFVSPQQSSGALSARELAKECSNPVTSTWQLQFQFNNFELENGKWLNNLYFQPVLPVSLTKEINLITRPVITLYQSVPHPTPTGGSERTTTFGDTVLAQVFSPADTAPWIFAIGPTWIFPTADSDFTGQGKWQVGPAIGGGYITNEFMIAAFAQQWWSIAGDQGRRATNQINILPLVYSFFGEGWSVGYSGNIVADWTARDDDVWTVPVGLSIAKVVQVGELPVQIQIAGQYIVERPDGGPEWNVQLQITPVIPRLINEILFE